MIASVIRFQRSTTNQLPSKLSPKFLGPYSVVYQVKNDVTCRNLITDAITIFHVSLSNVENVKEREKMKVLAAAKEVSENVKRAKILEKYKGSVA